MLLTAIEPEKRGFSRVYLDGEFAMRLDTETLEANGVRPGMELNDEELRELIEKSDARRATEKALYLLEHRSHSKKELREKVARAAGREAAQMAADRMEELGLIDDEAFARSYAKELFERKRFGAARVKQELFRKGIDRDIIEQVLEEAREEADPRSAIQELLLRKYPAYREDERVRRRAFAALQRMGYRYEEIRSALELEEE